MREMAAPSLFDNPAIKQEEMKLEELGRAVKLALNRAFRESNLSREEVAHRAAVLAAEAKVNLCPGGGLGLGSLNKWLDVNSLGHMPSLLGIAVLSRVLDDVSALSRVLEFLGLEIMLPADRKYRDVGKAFVELKQTRQRLKKAEERQYAEINGGLEDGRGAGPRLSRHQEMDG